MAPFAAFGLLLLIGVVDWLTGVQVRVFPLYFIPIMMIGSRLSRRYALAMAIAATGVWAGSNALVEGTRFTPPVQALNTVTMFVAFAVVAVLFAELRMRLRREHESSRTDPLTELPNRRGFLERASVVLDAGRRSTQPMTLAYIDLDHFKTVNDERGHAAGDAALRAIAKLLQDTTRIGDIVGRLGGDEFGALFPDTTPRQATEILERIRDAAAARMREQGWPITTSIGAITFHPTLELPDAMAAADKLMYAVKQGGGNRVLLEEVASQFSHPSPPEPR